MAIANIYDPNPIQPVVQMYENLAIWTNNIWEYYRVDFIEGIPRSSQSVVDFGAIAAGGTVARALIGGVANPGVFRLRDREMLHLRWEPIDDCEGELWEKQGQQRYSAMQFTARVNRFTRFRDPYLACTTFWILGQNRDAFMVVYNPSPAVGYALATSRFVFWGFRYVMKPLDAEPPVKTYLPAEGRADIGA